WPCGEADAVARVAGQFRQVLQADTLVGLAVAGGAGEVIGAGSEKEGALAEFIGHALFGMRLRKFELQSARLGGDPRREPLHRQLLTLAERGLRNRQRI